MAWSDRTGNLLFSPHTGSKKVQSLLHRSNKCWTGETRTAYYPWTGSSLNVDFSHWPHLLKATNKSDDVERLCGWHEQFLWSPSCGWTPGIHAFHYSLWLPSSYSWCFLLPDVVTWLAPTCDVVNTSSAPTDFHRLLLTHARPFFH